MATNTLPLKDAPETLALRAILEVLRSDPDLKRVGFKIKAWEGNPTDLLEPQTLAELPLLVVDPGTASSSWLSPAQHRVELALQLRVCVPGDRYADLFNAWGAVRSALFPQADPRRAEVDAKLGALVAAPTLTQQASGLQSLPEGLKALHATGVLSLILHVNT